MRPLLAPPLVVAPPVPQETGDVQPEPSPTAQELEEVSSPTTATGTGVSVSVNTNDQTFPGTFTRKDGRYRIDDLPAGEANVGFTLPPRDDSSESLGRRVKVALRAGKTSVADLDIATGSIAGVVTQRGRPVAAAFAGASNADGDSSGLQTDLKGRFHFSALPRGSWTVRVESVRDGETYRNVGLERAVIVGDGETRCDIELAATIISGRVIHAKSGEPATGGHVTLRDANGTLRAETQCEPAGDHFELEALGTGTYWVAVAMGNAETASGWIGPITLEEGVGRDGLVVPIGGSAELTAVVLEAATGRKLEGASVRLVSAGSSVFSVDAVTDAAGRASLADLPAGAYQLAVETDEHVPEVIALEIGTAPVDRTVLLAPASRK